MIDVNKIEFKKFPGGELHITDSWIGGPNNYNPEYPDKVICRVQESDDFMKLCLFTDACKRVFGKIPKELIIPYIPYARQDRVPNQGEALSIKVFTNLLNSLNYEKVTVVDPHSDVSTALIENVTVIPQWQIFGPYIKNEIDLISPDAGALKKIYKLTEGYNSSKKINLRTATKHRDTQTGWITDTTLDGEPKYKTCIVVDDICDGGGTFLALGEKLKTQYDKKILMITHGIFSKGISTMLEMYDEIYTTNSWNPDLESQDRLNVISVEEI